MTRSQSVYVLVGFSALTTMLLWLVLNLLGEAGTDRNVLHLNDSHHNSRFALLLGGRRRGAATSKTAADNNQAKLRGGPRPPSGPKYPDARGRISEDGPSKELDASDSAPSCPYKSLDDLTPEERFPRRGRRHIVDPPADAKLTLVCCETTAGPWNIAVHSSWAPHGADRFLAMVASGYFSLSEHGVPLMRCVDGFLCQFGLSGEHSGLFEEKIPDDPQWLPDDGDDGGGRQDPASGTKRFQRGYFAYAGSGPDTRGRQLFVALDDARSLGGRKSPWEVPWGELVGEHSFRTLVDIYTGYGEDGPSQDLLVKAGALDVVKRDFPDLDWILSCKVVDEITANPTAEKAADVKQE